MVLGRYLLVGYLDPGGKAPMTHLQVWCVRCYTGFKEGPMLFKALGPKDDVMYRVGVISSFWERLN